MRLGQTISRFASGCRYQIRQPTIGIDYEV
jgi:hypothetical protein